MKPSDTTTKQAIPEEEPLRLNEWAQPAAAMVALFAGSIGLLLLLAHPAHGSNLTGPLRPVYGAAWIIFAFVAASGVWSGLIIEGEEVVVRSRVRTQRYKWTEIKKFLFRPSLLRNALQMELRDGRRVGVRGFGIRSAADLHRAEELVAELNRRVPPAGDL